MSRSFLVEKETENKQAFLLPVCRVIIIIKDRGTSIPLPCETVILQLRANNHPLHFLTREKQILPQVQITVVKE